MVSHKEAVHHLKSIVEYCNEVQKKGSCFEFCALNMGWKCGIRELQGATYSRHEIIEHAEKRAEELELEEKCEN